MTGQQINMIDIGLGLHVRRIEYSETIPFIMGIHYARRMPCIQFAFGLFGMGSIHIRKGTQDTTTQKSRKE